MEKWFNYKLLLRQSQPQTKKAWLAVMVAGLVMLAVLSGFVYLVNRLSQAGAWTDSVALVTLGLFIIGLINLVLALLYIVYLLNTGDALGDDD